MELKWKNKNNKSSRVKYLIGGEMAVAVKEVEGGTGGRCEMVEIDHGVEGEESDEGVVGEVVVEEEEEVLLEGEELVVGGGEIDEKDEGRGRGRGRGGGERRRVLDGAVGGEELGGEVCVGDGAWKGVAEGAEGAVPDAGLVVEACVGVQNGGAPGAEKRVVWEKRDLTHHQWTAHYAQRDHQIRPLRRPRVPRPPEPFHRLQFHQVHISLSLSTSLALSTHQIPFQPSFTLTHHTSTPKSSSLPFQN